MDYVAERKREFHTRDKIAREEYKNEKIREKERAQEKIKVMSYKVPEGSKDMMVEETKKLQKVILGKYSNKKKAREPTPPPESDAGISMMLNSQQCIHPYHFNY